MPKKFLPKISGLAVCAMLCAVAAFAESLAFEVASVKPAKLDARGGQIRPLPGGQRYVAQNMPVKVMFKLMYKLTDSQIDGGPEWLDSDRWDIEAKAERPSSLDQLHEMFQTLLAGRFKLQFHREMREMSALALTVDKSGSKLKLNDSPRDFDLPIKPSGRGKIVGQRVPMNYFCWFLAQQLNRPVLNKTGLDQNYDFSLEWTPELPAGAILVGETAPLAQPDGPDLFRALREQLGLRLESQKGRVEVFVIDHAERPAEN